MNSQVNGENNNIWRSETEESIKRCKGFTERRYLDIVLKEENRALMGKKGALLKRSQQLDHFTRGQETSFCWVSTKWKDSMYFPFSHLIFITALQNRWCYSWFPYEGKIRLTAVTVNTFHPHTSCTSWVYSEHTPWEAVGWHKKGVLEKTYLGFGTGLGDFGQKYKEAEVHCCLAAVRKPWQCYDWVPQ